jgi:hypothetical protein
MMFQSNFDIMVKARPMNRFVAGLRLRFIGLPDETVERRMPRRAGIVKQRLE